MSYTAPVPHIRFILEKIAGFEQVRALPAFQDVTPDVVEAVLEGAGRFASEVLDPINASGDRAGSHVTPQGVVTPAGFKEAYQRFVDDGWNSLGGPAAYGGQGMPFVLHAATVEMWGAANMAFALCPELGSGAIAALEQHATPELRDRFLPKLVSGEWTGTMCLTEPQAGSDLSTVATRAEPHGDVWRLHGRKIYITWGEHDLAANTIHLVLARAPNAPTGVKGLSLFLVPRFRVNADGSVGKANDIRCVSVEHKMGIHASPTCVLAIGDGEGAEGYLVGSLHQGLPCMFTMMNYMRLGVGLHALGIAERSYQIARRYAADRVQGRNAQGQSTVILGHADVRRMLLTMKALLQAARGLAYTAAAALDVAQYGDGAAAELAHERAELLTPIVKSWCSDMAIEVTSLGVQVLGGMGFVEDAGAAQCCRDVRITAIYEGTNGIQGQDFLGRKVLRDGGRALTRLVKEIHLVIEALPVTDSRIQTLGTAMRHALTSLESSTQALMVAAQEDPAVIGATAVNYLQLVSYVCGGWQWMLAVTRLQDAGLSAGEASALIDCGAFYAAHILPRVLTHCEILKSGVGVLNTTNTEFL